AEAEEIEDEGVHGKVDAGEGVAEGGIEEKCE
ncbi:hypothetical protein A2U01_0059507, partial [Trifolium medium]|nr:hypothetical protein [Trifolium medium]